MSPLPSPAADLSRKLGQHAEAVCRRYLSNGCRSGRYWNVGDAQNSPGRSLFVRLNGPISGRGAAGRWRDAATGEHGDLLDLIRLNLGFDTLGNALDEARAFLSEPKPELTRVTQIRSAPRNSAESARRLFALGRSIRGTLAEAYLRARGITAPLDELWSLRFHPSCFRRDGDDSEPSTLPALLAAITDMNGEITAVQRTWLHPNRPEKAAIAEPRRSLGPQLGGTVRFGLVGEVVIAGEGVETILSLRTALPCLPMLAGLSADHLASLDLPASVTRLYVARDNDRAGRRAEARLHQRSTERGIEVRSLSPAYGDFNVDLQRLGLERFRARVLRQLCPHDRRRYGGEGQDDGEAVV